MKFSAVAARGLLLVAGAGFGLLLAELLVRVVAPQLHPIHPPGMYVEDPELGYALAPGFEGLLERTEFRDTIKVGPSGFRGVHVTGDAGASDSLTVFVLGDSQAFGFGVLQHETFSARLAAIMAERRAGTIVRVINGGIPGYGTADQLALLRARGPTIRPDVVVVQFLSVNDLQENSAPAREWAVVEDGMLTSRGSDAHAMATWPRRVHRWITGHSHLAHLVSNVAGYWLMRGGFADARGALWGEDFTAEQARLGRRLLSEVTSVADSLGARALLLYTTGQISVLQEDYQDLPSRAVVAAAADSAGVPWVDVTRHLRQRADREQLYYPINGHWTTTGHQAVAEIVADQLDRIGVRP